MTETFTNDGALVSWNAPQCPFAIEYSRTALDDIRLAVVDAFFSPPRGGVEIGGILLGRFENQRLQILDSVPIECEHAFGPVFTLSPADQVRLGELLGRSYPGDLKPVGWYHSHTRSELSLCEADVAIYNRHFPEPWHVALVLRPSTLQPTQAGFFFREADGSIHSQNSYHEFVVEALPAQRVPTDVPRAVPGPTRETEPGAVVLTLPSPEPEPAQPQLLETTEPEAETVVPEPEAVTPEPPHHEPEAAAPLSEPVAHEHEHSFASAPEPEPELEHYSAPYREPEEIEPAEPRPRWMGIAAGIAAGLVLGALANHSLSHSQPRAAAPAVTPVVATKPVDATLRKRNQDLEKQVAALAQENAALRKQNEDAGRHQADAAKQQADFAKQQAEVGQLQNQVRQQHDDLARQTAKLKADLTAQTARAQSLQQQLDDLRRQQQRRRLNIQSPDPLP